MMTRVVLANICLFVCASGAFGDAIQSDSSRCREPNSSNITCRYAPAFFWLGSSGNTVPTFSGSAPQGDISLLALDPGSPSFDFTGTPVGHSTTGLISYLPWELPAPQGPDRKAFELDDTLTAGGSMHRINQPVRFVFAKALDKSAGRGHILDVDLPSSVRASSVIYPKFDQAEAKEVPEQTEWSELLSISLGGTVMAGLAALQNRLIPR